MKRFLSLVLGFALLAGNCLAVEILVPTTPIAPGEFVMFTIRDLSDEQASKSTLDWTPKEGVTILPFKTWQGEPLLMFKATRPGKYKITIGQNGWAQHLQHNVDAAAQAKIDTILLGKLRSVTNELLTKYPYAETSADVTVGGEDPKPPPDPIVKGKRNIVIVREQLDNTVEFSSLLTLFWTNQKFNEFCKARGHYRLVIDDDVKNESGQPSPKAKPWIDLVRSKNVEMPAIVITDAATNKLVYVGPVPKPFDIPTLEKLILDNGG